MATKTNPGRFFEDYSIGEVIVHAVPRTVSGGERALYHSLYPARHAIYSSDEFARSCGIEHSPLDDLAGFLPQVKGDEIPIADLAKKTDSLTVRAILVAQFVFRCQRSHLRLGEVPDGETQLV